MNIPNKNDRHSEIQVRLSNEVYTLGPVLIYGDYHSGKTTLIKNIKAQFENRNISVDHIEFNIKCNYIDQEEDLLCSVLKYHREMMNRLKLIDSKHVNTVYKITDEKIESKVIIIDGFDELIMHDRKIAEIIKEKIQSILRLARAAGMTIIISCNRTNSLMLTNYMIQNIPNIILLSNSNEEIFDEIFGANRPNLSLGTGLYAYRNSTELFTIDNVKNL